MSKEFRIKLRKRMKGNKYNLGHKHSEKTKEKMSLNNVGMKGLRHSEETKEKMRGSRGPNKRSKN